MAVEPAIVVATVDVETIIVHWSLPLLVPLWKRLRHFGCADHARVAEIDTSPGGVGGPFGGSQSGHGTGSSASISDTNASPGGVGGPLGGSQSGQGTGS